MNFYQLTPDIPFSEIEKQSTARTQLIFKHSTRCIISSMALKRIQQCSFDKVDCWILDLLSYRDLSNGIADRYQIYHQSPQIIILKNGVSIANASHEGIDCEFIRLYEE